MTQSLHHKNGAHAGAAALPMVSVVVPTYRREGLLCDTLRQLLKQTYPSFEILVIDQTPEHEPETNLFLENNKKRLRHHVVETPGLPEARNIGVRLAKGEIILFVDDDIIPADTDLIAAHAACYAFPMVGAVAGRVLEPVAPNGPAGRADVNAFGRIVVNFSGEVAAEVGTAKGANMSFRKRVLDEVGLFDVRYMGNSVLEETDYCYRVRELGYEIRFEPRAAIRHLMSPVGGCREARWLDGKYWLFRNTALFYLKAKPRVTLPLFLGFFAARAALYVAQARGGPRDYLRLLAAISEGFQAYRHEVPPQKQLAQ